MQLFSRNSLRSRLVQRLLGGALGLSLAAVVMMTPGLLAQDSKPETKPAEAPATQPGAAAGGDFSITQTAPVQPAGIPIPNLPIVATSTLEGGIIAEDMKIGDGPEVKPLAVVTVHYHGTLKSDGKKFDSTFERAVPATMPLANLIKGWQVGIPGMKVGGIRRLHIPARHAYGSNPPPRSNIPPNADLVFEVKLLRVVRPN